MQPLTLPPHSARELRNLLGRSAEAKFQHRLHAVLLVAGGLTCPKVADLLGDSPRAVLKWVRGYHKEGIAALKDKPIPGRPKRLSPSQMLNLRRALAGLPEYVGMPEPRWTGPVVEKYVHDTFGVTLKPRQCSRLLKSMA
jgi:transposase